MLKITLRLLAVSAAALISVQGCASAPPPAATTQASAIPEHGRHNGEDTLSSATPAPGQDQSKLATAGVLLDRVVAVVNDDVILKSELDQQVAEISKQIDARNTTLPPLPVLRKQVLEQMVTIKLELQEAANEGISVSDDDVNQAISRIAEQNGLTISQLPEKLKEQGIDYASFRQHLKDQIIIQDIQQKTLQDGLNITPREVAAQLKADQESGNTNTLYHLSQILIAMPSNPDADQTAAARKKAETIYAKLKQGANFAATAIASSDGQQALKGGDLGWRKQSELPTIFTSVISSMNPGDISEPIQSPSGFHIVKLDDIKHHDNQIMVTQTHARHILIKTNVLMTDTQAQTKLDDLRKQILAGADFATLAKQYSEDTDSASQGGDLGWLDPGTTVPAFEQQMAKLQVGQISEPFKSQYGWHILQVLGRRKSDQTAEMTKNKAYEEIYKRKSEQTIQDWLSQLHGSSYIEYHLDDAAAAH